MLALYVPWRLLRRVRKLVLLLMVAGAALLASYGWLTQGARPVVLALGGGQGTALRAARS